MNLLSRDELRKMTMQENGTCISIFLPTHKAGTDTQQDPIRLKNLYREAEKGLTDQGMRSREVSQWLSPIQKLIDDESFWQHQSDGLAVFLTKDYFQYYRVPVKLKELIVVGPRFHVKPLMSLLVGNEPFFLLALSQNEVRFFHCTRFSIREVEIPGMPHSLADALKYDDLEKEHQLHSAPQAGGHNAMFHGHGAGDEDTKENLLRFFQLVDQSLKPLLGGQHSPLVLATVEYYLAIYEEANSYPHLLKDVVHGNPEGLKAEELHSKAWQIIEPHIMQSREKAEDRLRALAGNGQSSVKIEDVITAAYSGRVDVLFTPVGVQRWGRFDPQTGETVINYEKQPDDDDLLNVAAIQAFLNGGTVYAVEPEKMPEGAEIAAVYRY